MVSIVRNYTYFTLLLNRQRQNKSLHNQLLLLVKQLLCIIWIDQETSGGMDRKYINNIVGRNEVEERRKTGRVEEKHSQCYL